MLCIEDERECERLEKDNYKESRGCVCVGGGGGGVGGAAFWAKHQDKHTGLYTAY